VAPEAFMCGEHWPLLPPALQHTLRHRYRHGQEDDRRPSIVWLAAARTAIDTVAESQRPVDDLDEIQDVDDRHPDPDQMTASGANRNVDAGDENRARREAGREQSPATATANTQPTSSAQTDRHEPTRGMTGREGVGGALSGAESPTDPANPPGLVLMPYHAAPEQKEVA
jgi:hypothetical protein